MADDVQQQICKKIVEVGGEVFDDLELLGQGGMGAVYKAHQRSLNRTVAIKLLHPKLFASPDSFDRFRREAKSMAKLDHANIVRVYSLCLSDEHQPFLVLEYVQGKNLAELIEEQGPLDLTSFVSIFRQLLSALSAAHAAGLIHRDIKPANIMVSADNRATLMDFGIVKPLEKDELLSQQLTGAGALLGSPAYMSPEQCQDKQLDSRCDLYSLGCVMFEALTGTALFQGESSLAIMYQHINDNADIAGRIARSQFQSMILKAVQRDPDMRYQTAAEMLEGLELCAESAPAAPAQAPMKNRDAQKKRQAPLRITGLWWIASAVFIIASVIACMNMDSLVGLYGHTQTRSTSESEPPADTAMILSRATEQFSLVTEREQYLLRGKVRTKKIMEECVHFQESLNEYERQGCDPAELAVAYATLGERWHEGMGHSYSAESAFEKSANYFNRAGESYLFNYCDTLTELVAIECELHRLSQAKATMAKIMKVASQVQPDSPVGKQMAVRVLVVSGLLAKTDGRPVDAEKFYRKALAMLPDDRSIKARFDLTLELIAVLISEHRYQEAISWSHAICVPLNEHSDNLFMYAAEFGRGNLRLLLDRQVEAAQQIHDQAAEAEAHNLILRLGR